MTEFINTLQQLGCLPQFVLATLCLVTMVGLVGYGIGSIVKEINNG
jgi:hypothetical protein